MSATRGGPPEQTPLMVLLEQAARRLHDRFLDAMAEGGYPQSVTGSRLMGSLTKEGLRLSELAVMLGITKQSVGELVDELEAAGYVERHPDPTDGRAKLVRFGPKGRRSLPVAWRALRASDAVATDVLGERGEAQLRRALERLLASG